MSNLQSSADKAQMIELLNSIKMPIMGAGGGFAPIGVINTLAGDTAPVGWLTCDGTFYNISDYPELATYFASQFGESNHYGGDGITTFAVPNLEIFTKAITFNLTTYTDSSGIRTFKKAIIEDVDSIVEYSGVATSNYGWSFDIPKTTTSNQGYITVEDNIAYLVIQNATASNDLSFSGNVTVQYKKISDIDTIKCIKATDSDAHLDSYKIYSPNEHRVGWWQEEVDGVLKQKPVYEKTFVKTETNPSGNWVIVGTISDGELLVGYDGSVRYPDTGQRPFVYVRNTNHFFAPVFNRDKEVSFYVNGVDSGTYTFNIVVRYTKTTDTWQTV